MPGGPADHRGIRREGYRALWAEVSRAVELAQQQFRVVFEKTGSVYKITFWGYIDRNQVATKFRPSLELEHQWHVLVENSQMWTREKESKLVDAVANAVAMHRWPVSGQEADVYRLSAQLLKTRYQSAAKFLDQAAHRFYKKAKVAPRPFTKVVADGLVSDVPRLRNLLEKRMSGVHSW
jgi:xylose isomerase